MKTLRYLFLPVLLVTFGCQTSPKPSPDLLEINRFQPAAERGDRQAQYDLGAAYASQWRPVEASQWFRKAAEQGSPEAAYRLAVNHFRGEGVPEDVTEAYAWFDVAAAQGHVLAVNARESLANRMSHAEIGAGNRRAAVLIAKIPPQNLRYALSVGQKAEQEKRDQTRVAVMAATGGGVAGWAIAEVAVPREDRHVTSSQPASNSGHYSSNGEKGKAIQKSVSAAAGNKSTAPAVKKAPQFEPVDATEAMPVIQP